MVKISKVDYGTPLYEKSLALRQAVLRTPLRMRYSEEELEHDKKMVYFIYESDHDEIWGVVGLDPISMVRAQLRQMAVHEKTQGMGIGAKLVKYLEAHAKVVGFKEIHLDSRYTARGFYTKLGYEEYGEVYQKIGIPHINMKKTL